MKRFKSTFSGFETRSTPSDPRGRRKPIRDRSPSRPRPDAATANFFPGIRPSASRRKFPVQAAVVLEIDGPALDLGKTASFRASAFKLGSAQ
jgi:hypothetical protein